MAPNKDAVSRACENAGCGRAIGKAIRQARSTNLRNIFPSTTQSVTELIVLIAPLGLGVNEKKLI
jgi:hypothetical protein